MEEFIENEYDNRVFDICRKNIERFQSEGKLVDYVDFDFILYLYVTSTFNIYMYCKKNKIDDEKKRLDLKVLFFSKMFTDGILKK